MTSVFLGGEGPTELGRFARLPAFRSRDDVGILEALAVSVCAEAAISDAVLWKDIRHYKAGGKRSREQRLVLGLCLKAKEAGTDAVVFARDRDGDAERESAVAEAVEESRRMWPALRIVGGLPVEKIESWMLALCSKEAADHLRDPKHRAETLGVHRAAAVTEIENAGLPAAEALSPSLATWMSNAREALGAKG